MQVRSFYWYVLNKPLGSSSELTSKLDAHPFHPCGASQESSRGWVPAMSSEELVYEAHGAQLLMLKQEKRLLPASVVNDYLQDKVEQFEAAEGYTPSRKVRQQMKDDLIIELLPKAFTKSMRVPVVIFPKQGWLMVMAGSAKTADDLTAYLRECLGTLPVSLISSEISPSVQMTQWLSAPGELPDDWVLGEEVELKDADDAVVKVRNQDLFSDELAVHMDNGKVVTKLALTWREQVSLLLHEDLSIKRVKLLMDEDAPAEALDSDDGKYAHEFAVSCNWLVPMCQSLIKALGGLDKALAASQGRAFKQSA